MEACLSDNGLPKESFLEDLGGPARGIEAKEDGEDLKEFDWDLDLDIDLDIDLS